MTDVLTFLLQVGAIVISARFLGSVFRRFGQPHVLGEMLAGILLGPTLLGWVAPAVSLQLFPEGSVEYLQTLSQIGLLLFMFIVGLEFNPGFLRNQGHTALLISHASITAPFLLGSLLALFFYPRLSDSTVPFHQFAMFMGVAMSITAFPVLARILAEKDMTQTSLGALVLACAAIDDVTAWCILAYIVALTRSGADTADVGNVLLTLSLFILVMVVAIRPLLRRFERNFQQAGKLSDDAVAFILLLLLVAATYTEYIGVHLLFGAFLFGAIMPKAPEFTEQLIDRLRSITMVLLLPIFFAYSGLRTSIGLLQGYEMWFYCLLVIVVAIVGKLGGATLASRAAGMPWRDSLSVGVYMNTRGLMELVVLNIGLDLGIISPALFSMMVLMALVTTFMTGPAASALAVGRNRQKAVETESFF